MLVARSRRVCSRPSISRVRLTFLALRSAWRAVSSQLASSRRCLAPASSSVKEAISSFKGWILERSLVISAVMPIFSISALSRSALLATASLRSCSARVRPALIWSVSPITWDSFSRRSLLNVPIWFWSLLRSFASGSSWRSACSRVSASSFSSSSLRRALSSSIPRRMSSERTCNTRISVLSWEISSLARANSARLPSRSSGFWMLGIGLTRLPAYRPAFGLGLLNGHFFLFELGEALLLGRVVRLLNSRRHLLLHRYRATSAK